MRLSQFSVEFRSNFAKATAISPLFALCFRQTRAEMCTSETTICYGVVIRSWQLIVAAHAFIKFSPLLRGIDTVIFRQRNGTLRVEGEDVGGGKNVGDLPVEVLELIRSQAFDEKELIRAAKKLVEGKCRGSADWRTIPRPRDNSSDQFWDAHWDAITDVQFYGDNQRERVVRLPLRPRRADYSHSVSGRTSSLATTDSLSLRRKWELRRSLGARISRTVRPQSSPSLPPSQNSPSKRITRDSLERTE